MIYATNFTGCYLVHFKPFEERFLGRMEIFNEITNILLYGLAYTLTDLPVNEFNVERLAEMQ